MAEAPDDAFNAAGMKYHADRQASTRAVQYAPIKNDISMSRAMSNYQFVGNQPDHVNDRIFMHASRTQSGNPAQSANANILTSPWVKDARRKFYGVI